MKIESLETCTGCSACDAACPHEAISMGTGLEGFYIPVIDESLCTKCGLCDKVCPVLEHLPLVEARVGSYAVINQDWRVREESSSGGVFTALAQQVIDRGGVVFGAGYDGDLSVVHRWTDSVEGLAAFRGSKYTQSHMGSCFRKCREFLRAGRPVLFSGTPCQIAGLVAFLRKPCENLILVDFICHGVPSPKLWQEYKKYHEKKSATRIVRTASRRKDCGWKQYSLAFVFADASEYCRTLDRDWYLQLFLRDMCLMESCYQCRFKTRPGFRRPSDITLADFWGVQHEFPELDDDRGTSLVISHSEKGRRLVAGLENCLVKEIPVEAGTRHNPSYHTSVKRPRGRNTFFNDLQKVEAGAMDFQMLFKKYGQDSLSKRLYRFVLRCGGKVLRLTGLRT